MDAISATIVRQINGISPIQEVYTASEKLMLQHQLTIDIAQMRKQLPELAGDYEIPVFDSDHPFSC